MRFHPDDGDDLTVANLAERIREAKSALERDDPGTARFLLVRTLDWWDYHQHQEADLREAMRRNRDSRSDQ